MAYHDDEWGRPVHSDDLLFEVFLLESFVCGLSWQCVLHKREAFREAFSGFDCSAVAAFSNDYVESLMHNCGIIRHRGKICAAVRNASVVLSIKAEFGSFSAYVWSFSSGRVIHESGLTSSPLSCRLSADLRRRGVRFFGPVTAYAFLQAVGVISSHDPHCWLFRRQDL